MHSAKDQGESMKGSIARKRVKFGRYLVMVGLLLGMTVLSTRADMGGSLFTRSGVVSPEPVILAIFGAALISLGLFFRHQPSDSDSAQSDHTQLRNVHPRNQSALSPTGNIAAPEI
jgi:hypothetical protein